jgi:Animal haem peroxidase
MRQSPVREVRFNPKTIGAAKRLLAFGALLLFGCAPSQKTEVRVELESLHACQNLLDDGVPSIANTRDTRFLGKVTEAMAKCRGGEHAAKFRATPWTDWANYWATGDTSSKAPDFVKQAHHTGPNGRGMDGALLDLEYERIELIKFNLFDNNKTYEAYVNGRKGIGGPALKVWPEMRLPQGHPDYAKVGGAGEQLCRGELIRHRTLTGICNDIRNPLMGSSGQLFARNVEFSAAFPDLGRNELTKNRHGDRLGLLKPDPQLISRALLTRAQSDPGKCNDGYGLKDYSADANCDYKKAAFFNVLAAFWVQFMTHDWFTHLEEGHNADEFMAVGCSEAEAKALSCRPGDRIDKAYVAESGEPATFRHSGAEYATRAPKTFRNNTTAWWDASQIYGYDERSLKRVKRNPSDTAKLLLIPVAGRSSKGDALGYLPLFAPADPINPEWKGQEATAFPDNWTIGMSFYTNLFAREHDSFVDEFRRVAALTPDADCGLRNPAVPDRVIRYKDVTANELFEAARLVISAEIAKIHTLEWTTQLLYNEPLYRGMNANWNGLFGADNGVSTALGQIVTRNFGKSNDLKYATQWYSVFASGAGIFGLGSKVYAEDPIFAAFDPNKKDVWSLSNPDHVNGGVNHFGSPFNFPEEFVTVYRLHALVPDLIEYRELDGDPNRVRNKIPVVETFRGKATDAMRLRGLSNWALSMGRQRLGALALQNHPRFLQNLKMERLKSETRQIDVAALDLIRDRERGVPRYNEFRRQYGLRQVTRFDDLIDQHFPVGSDERRQQEALVKILREIYAQHICDASKIITDSQRNADGSPVNDCLGLKNGSTVDNVEDVDTVVGYLAESTRPHGYAISETQFVVFILNASRRLFSDRFLTSSFRPEFYTQLGVDWVKHNGPGPEMMERGKPNGHEQPVSPLKRLLLRTMPELAGELQDVVNVFDPWARDRGDYYSLAWKPRRGAESDDAFKKP